MRFPEPRLPPLDADPEVAGGFVADQDQARAALPREYTRFKTAMLSGFDPTPAALMRGEDTTPKKQMKMETDRYQERSRPVQHQQNQQHQQLDQASLIDQIHRNDNCNVTLVDI